MPSGLASLVSGILGATTLTSPAPHSSSQQRPGSIDTERLAIDSCGIPKRHLTPPPVPPVLSIPGEAYHALPVRPSHISPRRPVPNLPLTFLLPIHRPTIPDTGSTSARVHPLCFDSHSDLLNPSPPPGSVHLENSLVPGLDGERDSYQAVAQVGEGTFGQVYKARNNAQIRKYVALKRTRVESKRDGFLLTAMREIKQLPSLRHESVINLHEISRQCAYGIRVYGSPSNGGFSLKITFALLRVIHLDIKGSNILMNNQVIVEIAYFSLGRFCQKRQRTDYMSRMYAGLSTDALELFMKKPIFQGNDEIHQIESIYKLMGTPSGEDRLGLDASPFSPPINSTLKSARLISPITNTVVFHSTDIRSNLLDLHMPSLRKRCLYLSSFTSSHFIIRSRLEPDKPLHLVDPWSQPLLLTHLLRHRLCRPWRKIEKRAEAD
ncbi:hypothetical protein BS47DRAFT_1395630 [Hydnum rufescens UP504]|uniref:Protein kinase domain-containing protein n=1 Tax=Hydnum rufescens UP504 TaxID=1448309 RepID=A0A9P6ARW4_9AGAM|nr:hypothetical protein BS47DRAFT_1395630 [Hydnum rufescens UP504]